MRQANPIDELSRFLLKAGIIIGVIGLILRTSFIYWIGFALIIWLYIRTFSKNKQTYRQQNYQFLQLKSKWTQEVNRLQQKFQSKKNRMHQKKTHRFYRCPECNKEMRVPKGRGKITITCPACGTKFVKKS